MVSLGDDSTGDAGIGRCAVCQTSLDPRPLIRGADLLHGVEGGFTVHCCSRCGAGNTRPEATDAELAPHYTESYGPHGGSRGRTAEWLRRFHTRREMRVGASRVLRKRSAGRALDVGCGSGEFGALLIARGWEVDGLDPSDTACAEASRHGVRARVGTLDTVPLEPRQYDAVVFNHALEHIGDPVTALGTARAALDPSGVVAISVPNFDCWARRRFGRNWFHLDLPRHRVHFGERSLRMALEASGFEPQGIWTSTSPTGLIGSLQYRVMGGLAVQEGAARESLGLAIAMLLVPIARLEQAIGGGRDFLHAVGRPA